MVLVIIMLRNNIPVKTFRQLYAVPVLIIFLELGDSKATAVIQIIITGK